MSVKGKGCPRRWPRAQAPRQFCTPGAFQGRVPRSHGWLGPQLRQEGRSAGGRISSPPGSAPGAWSGAGAQRPEGRGLGPISLDMPGQRISISSRGSGACPSSAHHAGCPTPSHTATCSPTPHPLCLPPVPPAAGSPLVPRPRGCGILFHRGPNTGQRSSWPGACRGRGRENPSGRILTQFPKASFRASSLSTVEHDVTGAIRLQAGKQLSLLETRRRESHSPRGHSGRRPALCRPRPPWGDAVQFSPSRTQQPEFALREHRVLSRL